MPSMPMYYSLPACPLWQLHVLESTESAQSADWPALLQFSLDEVATLQFELILTQVH